MCIRDRGYAVQKTVNAVLAVLSVGLFFLTQPLVWCFRFVDWWTVLFLSLIHISAKAAVTYCMPLLLAVFDICGGIVSTVAGQMGGMAGNVGTLPGEISAAIGNVGFLASIPLWLVTILGSLFITVLSFILIMTVYSLSLIHI